MSFSFSSPAIPASQIKVAWREQYISSGWNKKFYGVVPPGIYRGLNLASSLSDNTITLVPDDDHDDHLVVYNTSDGFSLTFRDDTDSTYSLELSDASLLDETCVICLYMNYSEGATSTANFAVYTVAEFEALSAALQSELIVLGTVVNPASGVIADAAITHDRRSYPWTLATAQSLAWAPILKNTGFERSAVAVVSGSNAEGWRSSIGLGTWDWYIAETDPAPGGTKHAQAVLGSSGTVSGSLIQYAGVGITGGKRVRIRLSKKVVGAATGGTGSIKIGFFFNNTMTSAAARTVATFPIDVIDADYVVVDVMYTAPTDAVAVRYIQVALNSAIYGTSGTKLRIDDFSAWIEPASVLEQYPFNDRSLEELSAISLTLEDGTSGGFGAAGSRVTASNTLPTSAEGQVELGRKDAAAASASKHPAFSLPGRLINLGSSLLGTEADAQLARVKAPTSVTASVDYTLMWESSRSGESSGGYTEPVCRIYTAPAGEWLFTVNAVWGTTTWSKDVTGSRATLFQLTENGPYYFVRPSASDTAWATWTVSNELQASYILTLDPSKWVNISTADGAVALNAAGRTVYDAGATPGTVVMPIDLPALARITSIRITYNRGGAGTMVFRAWIHNAEVDTASQLGGTLTVNSGSGVLFDLIPTLTETRLSDAETLLIQVDLGDTANKLYGVRLTYDYLPT